jgi:hypothetical protein
LALNRDWRDDSMVTKSGRLMDFWNIRRCPLSHEAWALLAQGLVMSQIRDPDESSI